MVSESKKLNSGKSKDEEQQQPKTQNPSIYSLTMEEFQQTLFDTSKTLGSMNMDEFLNNICAAGEGEHQPQTQVTNPQAVAAADTKTTLPTQPVLTSQGSLTLPGPLSMKTVEEVWSEMSRDHQQQQQINPFKNSSNGSAAAPNRQGTLGEMTLEDFLVKAGVVRETGGGSSVAQTPQNYPIYPGNNPVSDPGYGFGSMTGTGFSGNKDVSAFSSSQGGLVVGDSRAMNNGSSFQGPGHRAWTGGYGPGMVNSSGLVTGHGYYSSGHGELETGPKRGRKRTAAAEGPVEKVVERRQRRMIKNREAASRSRARKQAYTVELEAALDKLKEENARLISQALLQEKKVEKGLDAANKIEMPRMAEKMKVLRRMWSSPLMV